MDTKDKLVKDSNKIQIHGDHYEVFDDLLGPLYVEDYDDNRFDIHVGPVFNKIGDLATFNISVEESPEYGIWIGSEETDTNIVLSKATFDAIVDFVNYKFKIKNPKD